MHGGHDNPITFTTLSASPQGVEEPSLCTAATAMSQTVGGNVTALPQRPEGPGLGNFSNVLSQPLRCWPNSPLQLHDLKASCYLWSVPVVHLLERQRWLP